MRYYFQALAAAALLGLGGVLIKPLTGQVSSISIAGFRSCFALLPLLLFWAIEQRRNGRSVLPLPIVQNRWQRGAALCKALNSIAFATALVHASTAAAFILCNMTPICILGWQLVFEKRWPNALQSICALVVAIGSLLYFQGDPIHGNAIGIVSGILGGFTFAGLFFCQGKLAQTEADKSALGGSMILGDAITIPIAFGLNFVAIEAFPAASSTRHLSPFEWPALWAIGMLAVLGIVQSGFAGWLLAKGQRGVDPMFMAFLPTLITVWAPTLTWKVLGEVFIQPGSLVGFVLVHAGVLVAAVLRARMAILATRPAQG